MSGLATCKKVLLHARPLVVPLAREADEELSDGHPGTLPCSDSSEVPPALPGQEQSRHGACWLLGRRTSDVEVLRR